MCKTEWILCPLCGSKTRDRIREDTVLKNYPLYCPKCKQETLISVSCLHFGQNNGKFSSIVSPRIFTRVLLPHTGHNNHCSAIIANPCFPPKLKVLHFHGANFVRECFCQNESN